MIAVIDYGAGNLQSVVKAFEFIGCRAEVIDRPERLAQYAGEGFSLVLSGHAHGGQIRLPGLGPVWVPSQGFFPEYAQGVHQLGRTSMAVSRGLGNSLFPQRILNRPEIVVETLLCGSAVR